MFHAKNMTSKLQYWKHIQKITPFPWLLSLALKDRPPPIIRQGPSNQTQVLGGVSLLRCQASGDPEPTVSWRKNGASLVGKDPRFSLLEHGSLQIQSTRVGYSGLQRDAYTKSLRYSICCITWHTGLILICICCIDKLSMVVVQAGHIVKVYPHSSFISRHDPAHTSWLLCQTSPRQLTKFLPSHSIWHPI